MSAGRSMPPCDGGLQNERTALAWVRTALSLLATSALMANQSPEPTTAVALLVLAIVISSVMIVGSERRHHWRSHALLAGEPVVVARQMLATACIASGLSAAGFLIVVF